MKQKIDSLRNKIFQLYFISFGKGQNEGLLQELFEEYDDDIAEHSTCVDR